MVLVHPWSFAGGAARLMWGVATELVARGRRAVTFDQRGCGQSTGRATMAGLAEIADVEAVLRHETAETAAGGVVLLGSSVGAPIAGSAIDADAR